MKKKYEGIFPALYSCYEDSGDASPERTRDLARYLFACGVSGLYANGSSGECVYLDAWERMSVLEAVLAARPEGGVIINHVAANNTRDSCALAAHAKRSGADAIAAIPPIYFHLSDEAIAAYWNDISASADGTDFFIYNIPQLAGVALSPSLLRTMLRNRNIVGVKNSSMPSQDIQIFKAIGGENFSVMNGPDEELVSGLAMGATGGIGGTYAAMPEAFLHLHSAFREGDMARARRIQFGVNEVIDMLCGGHGCMYAVCKGVVEKRAGIKLGGVRKPFMNLFPEDEAHVSACAKRIDELTRL